MIECRTVFAAVLVAIGALAALAWPDSAHAEDFDIAAPSLEGLKTFDIQFSEYHVVFAKGGADADIELLGPGDKPLGVKVSAYDFCDASLEGAVEVAGARFTVAGHGKANLASCVPPTYPCKKCAKWNLGLNRFSQVNSETALGGKSYGLIGYRTVAVRPKSIPLGTVLYIPAARGLPLPNGKQHDGYFFAGDVGAMKPTQLDLFIDKKNPGWSIIGDGSTGGTSSTAYVITDPAIVSRLDAAHVAAGKAAKGGE